MKSTIVLIVLVCLVPMQAIGHPHFFKEDRFFFDRGKSEDQSLTVSHMTVPFNEIATASLPEGEDWHLGFAQLKLGMAIELGGQKVEPGTYTLKIKREGDSKWSLFLQSDEEDDKKKTIELNSRMKSDLPAQDHLNISIRPIGNKEVTEIALIVRFGPNGIEAPVNRVE